MPLPVGGLPGTSGVSVNPQDFATLLNQKWPNERINDNSYPGNNMGEQWLNWYAKEHASNPSLSLSELENGFLTIIGVEVIKGGLTAAINATNNATNQIAAGTATGLSSLAPYFGPLASIGDFFGRLTQANTWLRIGEALVGIIVLAVGLNALLKQTTGVDVTKAIPKVVPV